MMKNLPVLLLFLGLGISQSALTESVDQTLYLSQLEPGMSHIEIIGTESGDFSAPHGVVSGFAASSSGMMFGQLFPPSQIMRQQEKLNLSNKQIESIKKEMRAFQSGIVDIQWDLNSGQAKLNKELDKDSIDLEKTLSLMDSVLESEGKLKKSHMGLLIKIRNVLNEEQIKILKSNPPFPFGPMGMPPMPLGMLEGSFEATML
jgi:hypothetical protein